LVEEKIDQMGRGGDKGKKDRRIVKRRTEEKSIVQDII
jgi:hypothetical protein